MKLALGGLCPNLPAAASDWSWMTTLIMSMGWMMRGHAGETADPEGLDGVEELCLGGFAGHGVYNADNDL
jgi:hypothetical protein